MNGCVMHWIGCVLNRNNYFFSFVFISFAYFRVYDLERKKAEQSRSSLRAAAQGTGDRTDKIRTYNYQQVRKVNTTTTSTINTATTNATTITTSAVTSSILFTQPISLHYLALNLILIFISYMYCSTINVG